MHTLAKLPRIEPKTKKIQVSGESSIWEKVIDKKVPFAMIRLPLQCLWNSSSSFKIAQELQAFEL